MKKIIYLESASLVDSKKNIFNLFSTLPSSTISSRGSLRETLVNPKDKLEEEETTGYVYHIPCAGANSIPCPGRYVGETERTTAARFQKHTSTASNALGK